MIMFTARPDEFSLDLWLLTHEDLRRTPRIWAFLDFLVDALMMEAPLLEGRLPDDKTEVMSAT